MVNTNTFGANILKFPLDELDKIVRAAMENAQASREKSAGQHEKFIALDIGPTGKLLKPYGDFDFEEAVTVFAETVKLTCKSVPMPPSRYTICSFIYSRIFIFSPSESTALVFATVAFSRTMPCIFLRNANQCRYRF